MRTLSRRSLPGLVRSAVAVAALWVTPLNAQQQPAVILIENVRIFDGTRPPLSAPSSVRLRGNIIDKISAGPIPADQRTGAQIIAGGGRVLMPGLIDAHWHATMVRSTPAQMLSSDIGYTMLQAGAEATATLMRGFTSV